MGYLNARPTKKRTLAKALCSKRAACSGVQKGIAPPLHLEKNMHDALATWIAKQPPAVVGVRIQVGLSKLETVALVVLSQHAAAFDSERGEVAPIPVDALSAERILEELEGNGWPELRGRVHALDSRRRSVSSLVLRLPGPLSERPSGSAIPADLVGVVGRLCLTVERMADANTRSLEVTSEALADREDVLGQLIAEVVESQGQRIDAEAEAVQAMLDAQLGTSDSEPSAGGSGFVEAMLAKAMGVTLDAPAPEPGPDGSASGPVDFADLAAAHPDEFRAAVHSERFARAVQSAYQPAPKPEPAPEPEPEPAPAPEPEL